MALTKQLQAITDHPKIAVTGREYDRINKNLRYYRGEYAATKYRDSNGDTATRQFNSLNMAKITAERLASLVFNESMAVGIRDNAEAEQFIKEQIKSNGFIKKFESYLETCYALGGLALRPYFDGSRIDISYIQAPIFYPLRSNTTEVTEGAIATKSQRVENKKVFYYTLLEFHEWNGSKYVITNELYRSENPQIVGYRVALSTLYENLEEQTTYTGLTRPLFVYMKPAGKNNKSINSPLGLSIYGNATDTLDAINETYNAMHWDIKTAKRRIAVTDTLLKQELKTDSAGNLVSKKVFDSGEAVFQVFGGDIDTKLLQDLTMDLRTGDYITAINNYLHTLEMLTGFSSGTFSYDKTGLKTATEVVSENSTTYQTRNSHLAELTGGIKELFISMLELAKTVQVRDGKTGALVPLYSGELPKLDDITLDFDDGVFQDKTAQLDYWAKMAVAGFASKSYAMKRLGLPESDINEILKELQAEQAGDLLPSDRGIYEV